MKFLIYFVFTLCISICSGKVIGGAEDSHKIINYHVEYEKEVTKAREYEMK